MRVDSALRDAAIQAVSRAAQSTGVDFGMLLETAKRESGLDRNAKAATSSAAGLFQFIESTWMGLIERHGGKYGLSPASDAAGRKRLLDLRYDPEIAANMAGELTRENSAALASRLGRQPSPGEVYAAHVMGADGAARLIAAPEHARAADLFPKAAAANRALFFDKAGEPVSAAALLAKLNVEPLDAQIQPTAAVSTGLVSGPSIGLLTTLGESFGFDLWSLAMNAYRQDKP